MIPPLRPRRGPRAGRTAAWLLVVALAAGCAVPTAPDEPVADDPAVLDETAVDDAAAPTVPSFGTGADALDATVVRLEPAAAAADGRETDTTVRVDARVADDAASRARGLMRVEELPDGTGMLFVYPEEQTGAFWMKDTLVALDIAFVAADGTVRAVLTMEPCTADPCPVYDPEVEYRAALEVPAGWLATNGIGVGARATWSDPVPSGPVGQ